MKKTKDKALSGAGINGNSDCWNNESDSTSRISGKYKCKSRCIYTDGR